MNVNKKNCLKLNIKQIMPLLFMIACTSLSSDTHAYEAANNDSIEIKIWNHDIGPRSGGLYLKDQRSIKEETIDSGCSVIPNDSDTVFYLPGYPSFDIQARISIFTLEENEDAFFTLTEQSIVDLTLPGSYVSYRPNIILSEISCVYIELMADLDVVKNDSYAGASWVGISDVFTTYFPTKQTDIVASWPKHISKSSKGFDLLPALGLAQHVDYTPCVTPDMLDGLMPTGAEHVRSRTRAFTC